MEKSVGGSHCGGGAGVNTSLTVMVSGDRSPRRRYVPTGQRFSSNSWFALNFLNVSDT